MLRLDRSTFSFGDAGNLSMEQLRVAFDLQSEPHFTYEDDEGDRITVTTNLDLREAARLALNKAPHPLELQLVGKPQEKAAVDAVSATAASDLNFYLNGKPVKVANPDPNTLLVDYLRSEASLTGTKIGCAEGGCGACTVVLNRKDPQTGKDSFLPVNSCLRPLCSMDGESVWTVEGIGSQRSGLHPIQERLAKCNGSQCGFCSPGWVMSMYALLRTQPTGLKEQTIEDHFDGNLCRCTGYRPILDAMKTFATPSASDDTEEEGKARGNLKLAPSRSEFRPYCPSEEPKLPTAARARAAASSQQPSRTLKFSGAATAGGSPTQWYKPASQAQLLTILQQQSKLPTPPAVQLVCGNTSIGVSKYYNGTAPYNQADEYDVKIDVSTVPELTAHSVTPSTATAGAGSLVVGGSVTLATLIELLQANASASESFAPLAEHLLKVATHQVRAVASWAGNLMLTKRHRAFPSDVALLLHTAGATITAADVSGVTKAFSPIELLNAPAAQTVLLTQVSLPFITPASAATERVVFKTYKMMQRAQNAHAHCNAGFFVRLSDVSSSSSGGGGGGGVGSGSGAGSAVVKEARLVFGGVSAFTFEATSTCSWLHGKDLAQQSTLDGLWDHISADLNGASASGGGGGPSAAVGDQKYRMGVMEALVYRWCLCCQPGGVSALPARLQSAASPPARPLSTGAAVFTPATDEGPVGTPVTKLEALLQASGEAAYTDDEALPRNALHGALVFSTRALATITAIDTSKALAMDGVVDVLTAADVPGTNALKTGGPDGEEHLFVPIKGTVEAIGMSLGAVLATSRAVAVKAAALVEVSYGPVPPTAAPAPEAEAEDDGWVMDMAQATSTRVAAPAPGAPPRMRMGERVCGGVRAPVISLRDAIAAGAFFPTDLPSGGPQCPKLDRGNVPSALASSANTLSGEISLGAQKHFYFEPQTAMAKPAEAVATGAAASAIDVVAATQGPVNMQQSVSAVLGVPNNRVNVTTRRSGGGFGGKLTRCLQTAGAAAVGAWKHGVAVTCTNDRCTDFAMVGGREAMVFKYDVGFDASGVVTALRITMYMDSGCLVEGSWGDNDMAMLWGDNTYYFANYAAEAKLCKTNNVTTTSMRSPGVVQAVFAVEAIIERVAAALKLPVTQVQEANFYKVGQLTPALQPLKYCSLEQVWSGLKALAKYDDTVAAVAAFNKANRWRKRGISMTPTKFGMPLSNYQSGATVKIDPGDGTVVVAHGGCEIGQGINTKVAQVAAFALGCDLGLVRVVATDTGKVPVNSMTGGSGTSESSSKAVLEACQTLASRLAPYTTGGKKWADAISAANAAHVNLMSNAFYAPTIDPPKDKPLSDFFSYFVWCAACSVVEVDVLTGQVTVLSSFINYDCGVSLNPIVDCGQIEGAFIMGLGYFLTEEVVTADDSGELLTNGTWEYKPPCSHDIPINLTVNLLKDAPNPSGILRSKCVGEPPYAIANSVYFAVKQAVGAARTEAGIEGDFELPAPCTVGSVQQACGTTTGAFKLGK